jgi:hypothetical protein
MFMACFCQFLPKTSTIISTEFLNTTLKRNEKHRTRLLSKRYTNYWVDALNQTMEYLHQNWTFITGPCHQTKTNKGNMSTEVQAVVRAGEI